MSGLRSVSLPRLTLASLLALFILSAACTPDPALPPTPQPDASPTSLPLVEPDLLLLPEAFRYEVTLRPAGLPDEPATVITGQYRAGALMQTARRGEDAPEELMVAADPIDGVVRSYTHTPGEARWTRWPGIGFDAAFGLASPFSALRLYRLADETIRSGQETLPDVGEVTGKVQAAISATTVERLLKAGASTIALDAEQRSVLESQLAPLFVPQTITYWVTETGRVYQAAATLLMSGVDGQPTPWLEVVWRYWSYDDPGIAVVAPAEFTDVADLALTAPPEAAATEGEAPLAPDTNLRVRVFAVPGVPAAEVAVTVYPSKKNQVIASRESADAQFAVPEGVYDVQVRAEKAETWVREMVVAVGAVTSQDVLFNFGALTLTVIQDGATPQVDIVIYPAGQRETWVDWRTENPTTMRLPAGVYDIEVALPDLSGTKRMEGVTVKAGETVSVTMDLTR